MSYALNFIVAIPLILTYGLGLTDQTMNDSPFHLMWVVGPEVQITICMRFPVPFCGQFRTPLHDQNIQEQKVSLTSTSIVNLMVGLKLFRW
jgi:hypothetical protein